jgi:hypothetical protein
MLDVLKFIFSDFWHWFGTLILLAVIAEGLGGTFRHTIITTERRDKRE